MHRIIKTNTLLFLLILLVTTPVFCQADSLKTAAPEKEENTIINELSSETQTRSNYFSVSKITVTIIILISTYIFLRLISLVLGVWAERNTKHGVTIKGLIPLVSVIIWTGSITFIVVAVFRPPMASILAFSAPIGVAIGFASQDLLKNVLGGIVIIFDKPFQIGDKVEIGDFYGEIVGIGLRSTRLLTSDDTLVSVPNSEVMNISVANANAGAENCQVVTEIFLPLSCDINAVRSFATEAAQVSRHIFLNKPIVILFFQENIGHKVMLKVKIKAYVNNIRNDFVFKSELTEILIEKFSGYYKEFANPDKIE